MIFLLDSNAFSDRMRKNARIEARLAALGSNDKVVICPIVRGEILYGIARACRLRTAGITVNRAEGFSASPFKVLIENLALTQQFTWQARMS